MRVVIIEDEIPSRLNLQRALANIIPDLDIVGSMGSVAEATEWFGSHPQGADLVFMDVQLSDGLCFDIFKNTTVCGKVVITTAYDHYALDAFKIHSVDYLLKPIEPAALKRAIARCRMSGGTIDVEALAKAMGMSGKKTYKERYIVRLNDRIVPLQTINIAYIYSEDKNNYMVTFDGQKYIIDSSLDIISEELDPDYFFRISRGCIVSMKSIGTIIKQMGGRLRIMATPEPSFEMTVSRSRVDDFMTWLER